MHYDLIIVGGGLVGASLALALRDTEMKIAVIDARLPANDDPRLFALNHFSCQLLTNLGLWDALSAYAAPIHQVHVSHQGHFGAVRLKREDVRLDSLGHVIPARHIENAMNLALKTLPNITLYQPATVTKLDQTPEKVSLQITMGDNEADLTADKVIAADGTFSTIRNQMSIETTSFDYQQIAVVTRTKLKRSHNYIAYERFNNKGAIAMLPLVGDECATIWSADKMHADYLMQLTDDAFLQKLQESFGYRLGQLQQIDKRHCFPLRMLHANKMVDGRVLLLGNSMHTLHPIAAQGFNLALYEVATLAEGINNKTLLELSEQTIKHQSASINMSHKLARMFSHDSTLMGFALSYGMVALDKLKPFKTKFIQRMMGQSGKMPKLLLGAKDL